MYDEHSRYLQSIRKKGIIATKVVNSHNNETIDTRIYSDSRRRHLEKKSKLPGIVPTKPPASYPVGSSKKSRIKTTPTTCFIAGPSISAVTPQNKSVYHKLQTNNSEEGSGENSIDSKINSMLHRISARVFKETGVLEILNVESI